MAKKNYLTPKPAAEDVEKDKDLTKLTTRWSVAVAYEKDQTKWWNRVLDALDFKTQITVGSSSTTYSIKYPLVWAAYDNYLSELTSTPSQVVIEADDRNDNVKRAYWKGILDYRKRRLMLDDLKEEFVQSFIVTGKAIYKVGRQVETAVSEKEVKGIDGDVQAKEEVEGVVTNETFVETVDPRRFKVSPETKYTGPVLGENCPYCIEEMIKTPEFLESAYGITIREDEKELISPDEFSDEGTKNSTKLPGDNTDDMKRVRLYAYYGVWEVEGKLEQNAEVLFTNKRIIRARKLPYAHGKKPYIVLLNFKKFFKPLAHGSLDAILDLDQEYNEHMNRIRTILRRLAVPKWAKLKGTQVDEAALLDPDVGLIVEESVANSFRPLEGPKVDPSLFQKATSSEQLFQLLTGIIYGQTALQREGTATGQQMAERGSDTKSGRQSRLLERADEELYKMILQLEQQYAPQEGIDIRITGGDIIQAIRNKKILYAEAMKLWKKKQQGQIPPISEAASQENGVIEQETPEPPPVDEYKNFEISDDGRSVYTTYTREEIEGDFELTVVSQSSNKSNRIVKSQQAQNALDSSATDPFVNRAELWKRKFTLDGWDDVDNLVNSQPQVPQAPVPPPTNGGTGKPSESAMGGAIASQASKTV